MTMTVTTRTVPAQRAAALSGSDAQGQISAEAAPAPLPARPVVDALLKGARCACPACGTGSVFERYLKVAPVCAACGEELYHHRADDAPPYAVIMVVGHIVVPLMVLVEELYRPPMGVHLALWMPLVVGLSLALLPPLKAMLINLQWALRMHGFDPASDEREAPPARTPSAVALALPQAPSRP